MRGEKDLRSEDTEKVRSRMFYYKKDNTAHDSPGALFPKRYRLNQYLVVEKEADGAFFVLGALACFFAPFYDRSQCTIKDETPPSSRIPRAALI
jgi:hypothetical protein